MTAPIEAAVANNADQGVFDATRPFGSSWEAWAVQKGWPAFVLPAGRKTPPPSGYTGYHGIVASYADLYAWAEDSPGGNIAIRMPRGVTIDGEEFWVVGIDVDAYVKGGNTKTGDQTLARWEAETGVKFPDTYRITSRGQDNPSGKRLYRVPAGTYLRTAEGDVDLLQFHHRYAVTAPSRNDDSGGTVTRLYDDRTGTEIVHLDDIPQPQDLPELPAALVEYLREKKEAGQARALAEGEQSAFLEALPQGEPCKAMQRKLDAALAATTAGSRHDAMLAAVGGMLRVAEMGHRGVHEALRQAEQAFVAAVAGERRGGADEAAREFSRMVNGERGVALILTRPTAAENKGCKCGTGFGETEIRDAVEANLDDPDMLAILRDMVGDNDKFERIAATVPGYEAPAPQPVTPARTNNRPPLALVPPVTDPATTPKEVTVAAPEVAVAQVPEPRTEVPAARPGPKAKAKDKIQVNTGDYTDEGNAQLLAKMYGDTIAFVPGPELVRTWRDTVWETDGGTHLRHLAGRMTDAMLLEAKMTMAAATQAEAEAEAALEAAEGKEAKEAAKAELARIKKRNGPSKRFMDWVTKSRMEPHLKAAASGVRAVPRLQVKPGVWDANPRLLNVANGTIVLGYDGTITFRDHQREDYITQQAGVAYAPDATCPQFEKFLAESLHNPAVRRVVRAIAGLTLVGDNSDHMLVFLIGKSRSGKTTLAEVMSLLLDNTEDSNLGYVDVFEIALLRPKRESGSNPQLVRLLDKRFAWTSEANDGLTLNADMLKQFSGGDRRNARDNHAKAKEVQSRVGKFTPWILTNSAPEVQGADDALFERIVAIPFPNKRAVEDRIKDLAAKLYEAEGPGILNWALAGLADTIANPEILHRSKLPQECIEAAQDMQEDMNIFQRWLTERTERCDCEDFKGCLPNPDGWADFKQFADDQRETGIKQKSWSTSVADAGHEVKVVSIDGKTTKVRRGIKFNDEAMRERHAREEVKAEQGGGIRI